MPKADHLINPGAVKNLEVFEFPRLDPILLALFTGIINLISLPSHP